MATPQRKHQMKEATLELLKFMEKYDLSIEDLQDLVTILNELPSGTYINMGKSEEEIRTKWAEYYHHGDDL